MDDAYHADTSAKTSAGMVLDRRSMIVGALCLSGTRALGAPASVVIRFAVPDNIPPVSEIGPDGQYSGMMETSVGLIGRELGWSFTYSTLPWKRVQEYVRSGALDAFCTRPSPAREAYVRFSGKPVFTLDSNWICFSRDNPRADEMRAIKSIDQLKTFRIALERGDAWPNEMLVGWNTTEVEDFSLIGAMLKAQRVDLAFADPALVKRYFGSNSSSWLEFRHTAVLPGGYTDYKFGLRQSFPQVNRLMDEFDKAHARLIASGEMEQALAPYTHRLDTL